MSLQDLPAQYTLTLTVTRPGADTFVRMEPIVVSVLMVTGDYETVHEALSEVHHDASALSQLERFDAALTVDPDALVVPAE